MAKATKKKAAPKKSATAKIKTTVKPAIIKTGRGGTPVPKGKEFSKDHQPSGAAKSLGHKRKRALKDILDLSTGMKFPDGKTNWRKAAATFLNIPEKEVSVRIMMEFRLIQRTIEAGDPSAFNAIFDRAYGKVKPQGEAPATLKITVKAKKHD